MADKKINSDEIREKLEPVGDAVAKAGTAIAKKAEPAVKAVGEKAREIGKAAGEKAAENQKTAEAMAREAGEAAGERAREAGKAAGDRVKAAGKAVGDMAAKAGKNAGEKAKANHEKAQAKAKQAGREAASAVTPIIYLQYGEKEYACDDLVERAKADFRDKNKGGIRSCKLYIKPEDNAVYYVISGKEGKIDL